MPKKKEKSKGAKGVLRVKSSQLISIYHSN